MPDQFERHDLSACFIFHMCSASGRCEMRAALVTWANILQRCLGKPPSCRGIFMALHIHCWLYASIRSASSERQLSSFSAIFTNNTTLLG